MYRGFSRICRSGRNLPVNPRPAHFKTLTKGLRGPGTTANSIAPIHEQDTQLTIRREVTACHKTCEACANYNDIVGVPDQRTARHNRVRFEARIPFTRGIPEISLVTARHGERKPKCCKQVKKHPCLIAR